MNYLQQMCEDMVGLTRNIAVCILLLVAISGWPARAQVQEAPRPELRSLGFFPTNEPLAAVAFETGPECRTLAAGAAGKVYLWDVPSFRLKATLTGYTGTVNRISWPLGGFMATSTDSPTDHAVIVWETRTGRKIVIPCKEGITAIASFLNYLAIGTENKKVYFWDVSQTKLLRTFDGFRYPVCTMAITGSLLTVGVGIPPGAIADAKPGEDGKIRVAGEGEVFNWNWRTGVKTTEASIPDVTPNCALSGDHQNLAILGSHAVIMKNVEGEPAGTAPPTAPDLPTGSKLEWQGDVLRLWQIPTAGPEPVYRKEKLRGLALHNPGHPTVIYCGFTNAIAAPAFVWAWAIGNENLRGNPDVYTLTGAERIEFNAVSSTEEPGQFLAAVGSTGLYVWEVPQEVF